MSVSHALEGSASAFNRKYACEFDFATFEERVEEFTLLRPNGGWIDVYKMMFERMYKQALESAAKGLNSDLDGEAMIDDFEYTLIRPYVNESRTEIKHKHYVGMDRLTRLAYLNRITCDAPRNAVELYAEKYRSGTLTLEQMRAVMHRKDAEQGRYVEIAGYVQALEDVNRSRTTLWRALHPLKNRAERRDAASMKRSIIEDSRGGESFYDRMAAQAYEVFDGHKRANENLAERTAHAIAQQDRLVQINDGMRESLRIDGLNKAAVRIPVGEQQL